MHDEDLGDLGLCVGKDYYLLCLSTQLISLMISCPINSVFLGNFKCGYTFNSMKQSTDTAWLGRSIVVLVVKPDLQQHTDGTFGSTGLSLEDQEVKVKVEPGGSGGEGESKGVCFLKIWKVPWSFKEVIWGGSDQKNSRNSLRLSDLSVRNVGFSRLSP